VALGEHGDGSEVHFEPVAGHNGNERFYVGRAPSLAGRSSGALSLKYCSTLAGETISSARVLESEQHVARLEDEIARPGDANLVPELDAELAL
jgi:hypothetical protein